MAKIKNLKCTSFSTSFSLWMVKKRISVTKIEKDNLFSKMQFLRKSFPFFDNLIHEIY